jgi:hypothetical protein
LRKLGKPYSLGYLWRIWKLWRDKFSWDPIHDASAPNICSMLYADSFLEATTIAAVKDKWIGISPADLSASPVLSDVEVGWLRLPTTPP